MRPIALITDFGTRDPYVAAMKGVIAARTTSPIHDLTHEIAPFDVLEGAWFLKTVVDYWPKGTIFVCVVDPGVGTERKIVAAEVNGQTFLAPDNGLLTFVASSGAGVPPAAADTPAPLVSVERSELFIGNSTTFHGRDRFAPVAAAIANGLPIEDLGPPVAMQRLSYEPPMYGDVARGTIVAIDRFGNAVTDLEAARVAQPFALRVKGLTIDRVERTYGDAAPGPFLIVGSSGHVEISIADGSAADALQLSRLETVELWRSASAAVES